MYERTTRYELECCICGVQFVATRHDAKYCSRSCGQKAYRQRQQLNAFAIQPFETRIFSGHPIQRRRADGWVNATAMCKAGGKRWNNYERGERTSEYICALQHAISGQTPCAAAVAQNRATLPVVVETRQGGDPQLQGTWIHPRLAVDLARWISPEFAVWMDGWILGQFNQPAPTTRRINAVHGLSILLPTAIERYHQNKSDDLAKVIAESAMYIALMYNNPGPVAALELGLAGNRFIRDLR